MMASFHFLRPLWLLALLPLAWLLVNFWRRRLSERSWQAVVDPQLLPHVLVGQSQGRSPWAIAALGLAGLLSVTALAGPAWSRMQVPVFRRDSALVVLFDLSRSMNAADLKPSRLQLAEYKLQDILARRKEGETALAVYAADPFVVTPLTSDVGVITRQLPVFTTDLMPAQGSRADRAIAEAQQLLQQGNAVQGQVLLVTDGVENTPPGALNSAVDALTGHGYRLSVLGVGTPDGAPIPDAGGGFFKDDQGAIVWAKLDENALSRLAARGHGIYRRLAPDDSDTNALTAFFDQGGASLEASRVAGVTSDQWQEEGPWLLLLVIPLAAFAFRRGYLMALVVAVALMLVHPAHAEAMGWSDLWQNGDQQGAAALAHHDPAKAAKLFHDPLWRAVADYRAGNYQAAVNDLKGQPGALAAYNRGNALAHLGQFQAALDAYDAALKLDPKLADAKYNRDLVKKWLKQHPPKPSQNKSQKNAKNGKNSSGKGGQSSKNGSSSKQSKGGQHSQSHAGQQPRSQPSARPTPGAQGQSQQRQANKRKGSASQAQQQPAKPGGKQSSAAAQRRDWQDDQGLRQWLQRVPDDPGGLWRRKFLYQYKQEQSQQQSEAKPW